MAVDPGIALINTQFDPPGQQEAYAIAQEAAAYHTLNPYSSINNAFSKWKTEDLGPLPTCMPIPRIVVRKGAQWLFGKPLQVSCPNNKPLEAWLRKQWIGNRMNTRTVSMAERGAIQGGVVLKWSYDEDCDPQLNIQVLSAVSETQLFYNPHNRNDLWMARIQYPYFETSDGKWYWHREEWTRTKQVSYKPLLSTDAKYLQGTASEVRASMPNGKWVEDKREENKARIIPVIPIKNIDCDATWGAGDLWSCYRAIDRLNLAYHIADKSNQLDSNIQTILIDAEVEEGDQARMTTPGQVQSIKSDGGPSGDKEAKVVQLEPSGKLRDALMEYIKDVRHMLCTAGGSVYFEPGDITNKGNLTAGLMLQLYAPLVASTQEKRKTYGEDGICKFLQNVAFGLKNAGIRNPALKNVNVKNEDTYDVQLTWAHLFEMSPNEKLDRVNSISAERAGNFISQERAIELIASMEDIDDVDVLKEEIQKESEDSNSSVPAPDNAEENNGNDTDNESDSGTEEN